ncbi:Fic family protein [Belliella buryatensis]|uniref:Fic family protein n=1 Tax=Belliella buryatensis TaxID=1500549 RepID=A0A239BVY2_9BACT|nr:Fic family protein [Belliella buryatensis]SNS11194.1 Fic family protein [Belliella buryatensis]
MKYEFNIGQLSEITLQLMQSVHKKKQRLDEFRPIPYAVLANIRENLNVEWTYNSNHIEGNTLTLQETRMVLEDGITVGGKSLNEHLEIVNHKEAITYVQSLASADYKLTERDVLDVHEIVLNKIQKDFAGRFRTAGVRIGGANFIPPNALRVPDYITELIEWENTSTMDILEKVTLFHHRFVWVHPFFDGNGRTVRLLMNLLLMKEGFPPAVILGVDRKRYYQALNLANNGNFDKLLFLIVQAVDRSLTIYLNSLEDTAADFDAISNIVQEPEVPYGQEYISLLARQGKIEAYKEGRVWYTSKKSVENYLKNKKGKKS